jgi:hypothetical protein
VVVVDFVVRNADRQAVGVFVHLHTNKSTGDFSSGFIRV